MLVDTPMADQPQSEPVSAAAPPAPNPAWERVQLARHPKRPHSLDYIERLFTEFQEIHGDRWFGDDPAIVAGIGLFDGAAGDDGGASRRAATPNRSCIRNFGMPKPEGYRKALRAMQMAAKFGRPIITSAGHARAPTPASTPRSAARPKPSRATCGKCRGCRCP